MPTPILEVKGVTKEFPGVVALDSVSLSINAGEIHALVGENGAGKSTLIKVLSGVYQPDRGEIYFDGRPVRLAGPSDAQSLGIAVIHQELMNVPHLSVAENITLGRPPMIRRGVMGMIDWPAMNKTAHEALERLGVSINPRAIMKTLSVSQMQVVEIARAVSSNARLLIMDEPTSALSEDEVDRLFNVVKALKAQGVTVIFITHRLDEVFRIADRITILRDGKIIATKDRTEISREELIKAMVGRPLGFEYPKRSVQRGKRIMSVENLSRGNVLRDINFSLFEGEILGIAGLMGAGKTELVRAIFGADKRSGGRVLFYDEPLDIKSPQEALRMGIGLVPEDRKRHGLVLGMSVRENMSLSAIDRICRWSFVLDSRNETIACRDLVEKLGIKTPGLERKVKFLSGGNQQKVVLGKCLFGKLKLILFDEPTRGIDVGAKAEIYRLMNNLVEEGVAVIMVSSELPEVIGMSDRILVMHEGRIAGELDNQDQSVTQEEIMRLATGQYAGVGTGTRTETSVLVR
ncbi:MAG: sugar ABC transporter ATP-binding protein [Firmicutes bacterium]|nr:sugar ABC transporter ATP-binding protein [Bacillota bacterium]